jgi:hypothetical protein
MKELSILRMRGEEPEITPKLAKLMNQQKKQDPETPPVALEADVLPA